MEWTKSETLKFIQLLEVFPCLWNNKNKDYKNRQKRLEALEHLAQEINTNINSIEKKILCIKTQYNRELQKVKKNSEAGLDDTSNWYAFDHLHFLKDRDIQRPNIDRPGTDSFTITFEEKQEDECVASPDDSYQTGPNLSANTIEDIFIAQPTRSFNRRSNSQINTLNFSNDMSNAITRKQKRDDFSIFGEVVASELRDLKTKKQVLELKKRIMNLIYETKLYNLENT